MPVKLSVLGTNLSIACFVANVSLEHSHVCSFIDYGCFCKWHSDSHDETIWSIELLLKEKVSFIEKVLEHKPSVLPIFPPSWPYQIPNPSILLSHMAAYKCLQLTHCDTCLRYPSLVTIASVWAAQTLSPSESANGTVRPQIMKPNPWTLVQYVWVDNEDSSFLPSSLDHILNFDYSDQYYF
jgi:hypothetical protein